MVFTSDRAGRFELWWGRLGAPDSLRPIEGVRPDTRQAPSWAPDGRRFLLTALDAANAPMILEVEPASGRIAQLDVPAHRPAQALYGPAGTLFVLEEDTDSGGTSLVAYDRATWQSRGRIEDVSQVRFDHIRDRVLYTRLDANGLWEVPPSLDASRVTRLSAKLPSRWRYRSWSLASDGRIAYLDATAACWTRLSRYRVDDGSLHEDGAECVDPLTRSATNGFSFDGTHSYVSLASDDGSGIGFMALPTSRAEPGAIVKLLISLKNKLS